MGSTGGPPPKKDKDKDVTAPQQRGSTGGPPPKKDPPGGGG